MCAQKKLFHSRELNTHKGYLQRLTDRRWIMTEPQIHRKILKIQFQTVIFIAVFSAILTFLFENNLMFAERLLRSRLRGGGVNHVVFVRCTRKAGFASVCKLIVPLLHWRKRNIHTTSVLYVLVNPQNHS